MSELGYQQEQAFDNYFALHEASEVDASGVALGITDDGEKLVQISWATTDPESTGRDLTFERALPDSNDVIAIETNLFTGRQSSPYTVMTRVGDFDITSNGHYGDEITQQIQAFGADSIDSRLFTPAIKVLHEYNGTTPQSNVSRTALVGMMQSPDAGPVGDLFLGKSPRFIDGFRADMLSPFVHGLFVDPGIAGAVSTHREGPFTYHSEDGIFFIPVQTDAAETAEVFWDALPSANVAGLAVKTRNIKTGEMVVKIMSRLSGHPV